MHRRYDANAVRRAALTAELVRYGITITGLDPFGEYLDGIVEHPKWHKAVSGEAEIFLAHSIESIENGRVSIRLVDKAEDGPMSSPLNIIEATRKEEYGVGVLDVSNYTSALVINLTKLFVKLKL